MSNIRAAEQHFNRAVAFTNAGQLPQAAAEYEAVLEILPENVTVLSNFGILCAHLGQFFKAAELLRRATTLQPDLLIAWFNLAVVLQNLRSSDAMMAFERVLELDPANLEALNGLGNIYADQKYPDKAISCFERALVISPNFAPALVNLSRALTERGDIARAIDCCRRVAVLRPNSAEAHFNLGTALKRGGHSQEAAYALQKALAIDPNHVDALVNYGNLLKEQNQFEDAAQLLERALALRPHNILALNNLGHIRREQGRADDSTALHAKALALDPADAHARFAVCIAHLPIIYRDTAHLETSRMAYGANLRGLHDLIMHAAHPGDFVNGIGASQPFYLPYQNQDDRQLQSLYGDMICRIMADYYPPAALPVAPHPGERIRVGFVSGFFRDHSNWKIPVGGWLRGLDRQCFEVFGYYTNDLRDGYTKQAQALCDRFVQGKLSLERWRQEIIADAPHVLIYPEIGMDPVAVQLAAQRLAPVQCNSWGQPVTSGMPTLDYFLSSALMEPEAAERFYTETLVRLPNLSIDYDPLPVTASARDRASFGLRSDAVVYWCGQSLYKFLPENDWIFPAIAGAIENCQFMFIRFRHGDAINALFLDRMRAAFAAAGLHAEDHMVMAPYLAGPDFAASLAVSDIFLDSMGWSGCNTTLESVASNLPVVTLAGQFMRGRHGAAILTQLNLAELIAPTEAIYRDLAIRLGRDPAWRQHISQHIAANKHRLLHDRAPVEALQSFLVQVVQNAYSGLVAAPIFS